MKHKSICIFIGMTLIIFIVFSIKFLPVYLGYCDIKNRFLSDKEKIEIAIQDILVEHPIRLNDYEVREDGALIKRNKEVKEYSIPYKNVEEFLKKNPNCCDVRDNIDGEKIPFNLLLSGKIHSFVRIRYKVYYATPPKETLITEYRAFSNCNINHKELPFYKIERL